MIRRLPLVLAVALLALPACKKKAETKKSATELTGLAAVPADAAAVISFDVG